MRPPLRGNPDDGRVAQEHVDPADVMHELNTAARGLDKAANRLHALTQQYEGHVDPNGEYQPGPQLRWLEAVGDALDDLSRAYEDQGKRAPAAEILSRRAERRAKDANPDLWADYHRLRSEIQAMERWMRAKRETIGARQSWPKAHGALS